MVGPDCSGKAFPSRGGGWAGPEEGTALCVSSRSPQAHTHRFPVCSPFLLLCCFQTEPGSLFTARKQGVSEVASSLLCKDYGQFVLTEAVNCPAVALWGFFIVFCVVGDRKSVV